MKPEVYIETSIVSYLTARPSRDLRAATRQELTLEWWGRYAPLYTVYVSDVVVDEISDGDDEAANRRLACIEGVPVLELSREAKAFSGHLAQVSGIPPKAAIDALHMAVAALSGMEYLLTWNCKHLANATIRRRLEAAVEDAGFYCPAICTPEELLENYS